MSKGNFSCHSFTEQGRDNWETIFRKQKRHQEINKEVDMKNPPNFETAAEKDYYKGLCEKLSKPVTPSEEEIELTPYDMNIQQGMDRN